MMTRGVRMSSSVFEEIRQSSSLPDDVASGETITKHNGWCFLKCINWAKRRTVTQVKLRVKKSSDLCFQQWIIRWYTEIMISNRKGFAIWIEYDDEVTHQPPKSHDAILFTLEQASRLSLPIHSSSARVAFSVHLERCENVWDLQALQELNYSSHMQILRSLRNLFDSLLEPSLTHSQQAFLSTSGGN